MIKAIYSSNTGLNAMQKKMDVIANNIANVNTEGFKQSKLSFREEMNGVFPEENRSDFSAGNLKQTDRQYDFALEGDAFFQINTPQGFRYSRNGSFTVNESGYLVDNNGNKVVGVAGDIKVVDGKPNQDFYLVNFKNKEYLIPSEAGFVDPGQSGLSKADNFQVLQNVIENSNVDLVQNIADMISTARSFSLNSRMVITEDDMLKKAVDEIGTLK